jgi:hypothetical protein
MYLLHSFVPTLQGNAVRRGWFGTKGGEGALGLDQQSLRGLVTLYAAFVQTEPPKGTTTTTTALRPEC